MLGIEQGTVKKWLKNDESDYNGAEVWVKRGGEHFSLAIATRLIKFNARQRKENRVDPLAKDKQW